MEKPEILEEEHLKYLDGLRESGIINMFGAAPYVSEAFSVKITEAREILSYWMVTFSKRHSQENEKCTNKVPKGF